VSFFLLRASVIKSLLILKPTNHEAAVLHREHEEKNKQKIFKDIYSRILKVYFFSLRAFVIKWLLILRPKQPRSRYAARRARRKKN
ncbi:hypothetical protein MT390_12180, partial [Vibrio sp. 2-Bac 85]